MLRSSESNSRSVIRRRIGDAERSVVGAVLSICVRSSSGGAEKARRGEGEGEKRKSSLVAFVKASRSRGKAEGSCERARGVACGTVECEEARRAVERAKRQK